MGQWIYEYDRMMMMMMILTTTTTTTITGDGNRSDVVGMAGRSVVRIQVEAKDFFFLQNVQTRPGAHTAPY
jgi:hypothetical protein